MQNTKRTANILAKDFEIDSSLTARRPIFKYCLSSLKKTAIRLFPTGWEQVSQPLGTKVPGIGNRIPNRSGTT
ncbi:hypothetical protein HMPREF9137_1565 [Prevotella denticola F0289]|nr:hypothetical protein HMPREF9137_1565 [Prevotella denticola F0289]